MNALSVFPSPIAAAPADQGHSLTRSERITATDWLLRIAHDHDRPDAVRDRALESAITINLPVAASIASRHRGRGIPLEDLEQVAYAALVRTAGAFDPDRGRDFLAYAVPSIRGEVKRWFRDHGWAVRPPRSVQENQSRVVAARDELESTLGRPPRTAEVAARAGVPAAAVRDALAAQGCFRPVSLDTPTGAGEGAPLGDLVPGDDGVEASALSRAMVAQAFAALSARDCRIVRMRWFEECTQQEIADLLGTSQVQVSRALARILDQLRELLDAPPADMPPAA